MMLTMSVFGFSIGATMYGLLFAVTSQGAALGATCGATVEANLDALRGVAALAVVLAPRLLARGFSHSLRPAIAGGEHRSGRKAKHASSD